MNTTTDTIKNDEKIKDLEAQIRNLIYVALAQTTSIMIYTIHLIVTS
jgi:hypothetical protein